MPGIDLHVHTTASDGRFSPADIVTKAAALGITVLGITDHDSVDGIPLALEAARAFPQLTVVPGVEINTDVPDGEAHILGYFMDYRHPVLVDILDRLRNTRIYRAHGMIEKLGTLGMPITFDRVRELAGTGSIGRPHIAQALLEKGYIKTFREAFDRYIGRNCPAYVEREKILPEGAVDVILQAGGLPVLAHPFTVPNPETMVENLVKVGLAGIEMYYGGYRDAEISRLAALASKYNLIATGGTDYHGLDSTDEYVMGAIPVPQEAADRLLALAEERGCAGFPVRPVVDMPGTDKDA